MKQKRFLLLVAALFLLIAGVQCTSQPDAGEEPGTDSGGQTTDGQTGEAEEPAAGEEVTLRLWIMGTGDQEAQLAEWIPMFEEQNPNITVEDSGLDWASGKTQIMTAFAGGVGPDVTMAFNADIPQWVANGAFTPLDDYFSEDDFLSGTLSLGEYEGQLYAIPWTVKPYAFYWRKDIYEEVGLDPESPPETWDELIEYAQATTMRDDAGNLERAGYHIFVGHPYKGVTQFANYLWSAGGNFFSEDGCQVTFNSPEGVAAVQLLSDLVNEYKVDQPGAIEIENLDFAQGRVASLSSNVAVRGMDEYAPDLVDMVGIAAPAHTEGQQSYAQYGGNYLGISGKTQHFDEALELVTFLTMTPEIARDYALIEPGAPALREAANEQYFEMNPFGQRWVEILEENGRGIPLHPAWAEIQNHIRVAMDQVFVEGRDAQEALDEAVERSQQLVDQQGCAYVLP